MSHCVACHASGVLSVFSNDHTSLISCRRAARDISCSVGRRPDSTGLSAAARAFAMLSLPPPFRAIAGTTAAAFSAIALVSKARPSASLWCADPPPAAALATCATCRESPNSLLYTKDAVVPPNNAGLRILAACPAFVTGCWVEIALRPSSL